MSRPIARRLVQLCGLLILAACQPATTVYIVRHAEKASGKDPNLTAAGHARAQALARVLAHVEVDAIYATQYRRTVQTVQPLAEARSLPVRTVRSHDTRSLLEPIGSEHAGKQVVISGHSNTVPDIIRALGVREPVSITTRDYGDLFVVTVGRDGQATLERRRFDP